MVTTIIHRIVFLHPKNDNGDTPFHLAANNGHTQVLASFLRRMKHKSPRPSLHNRTTSTVVMKNNPTTTVSNQQNYNSIQNQTIQDKTGDLDQTTVPSKRTKRKCNIL